MAQQSNGDALADSLLQNESKGNTISVEFEELLEQNLKGFSWAMFLQVILVGLSAFFDSQQSFISIYTDAIPTWHCINNGSITCNSKHSTDICKLPTSEWAWDEIPTKTIISGWGLQCSIMFLKGLPVINIHLLFNKLINSNFITDCFEEIQPFSISLLFNGCSEEI